MTLMPRRLRVEYPGAIYYLLNWGDREKDTAAGREEFERRMERRRQEEGDAAEWRPLRRGWCPSSEQFRAKRSECSRSWGSTTRDNCARSAPGPQASGSLPRS